MTGRAAGRIGRRLPAWLLVLLLAGPATALAAGPPAAPPAAPSLAATVMAGLARLPSRSARFTEERRLSSLTRPLLSSGTLSFTRPDRLEQDVESPRPERLVIEGDRLTVTEGAAGPGDAAPRSRTVPLDAAPALRALADTLRAALAGDLPALERIFSVQGQGTPDAWRLMLVPRDAGLRAGLARVTLDGAGDALRQVTIQQQDGDEQRLLIGPP